MERERVGISTTNKGLVKKPDDGYLRPIWGFGPMGWLLMLCLLTLSACWARFDLVFGLQWSVCRVFGSEAVMHLTVYGLVFPRVVIDQPAYAPFGLAATLLALHIAPGRRRLLIGSIVVAWVSAAPRLFFPLAGLRMLRGASPDPFISMLFAQLYIEAASCVLLALLTRSWRVGMLVGLACACTWGHVWYSNKPGSGPAWPLVYSLVAYQVMIAAVLLAWAVRGRLSVLRPGHICEVCGYDLLGTPSPICPECGHTGAGVPARLMADE